METVTRLAPSEAAKVTRLNTFEPPGVMDPGMHMGSVKARGVSTKRDQKRLTKESSKGG